MKIPYHCTAMLLTGALLASGCSDDTCEPSSGQICTIIGSGVRGFNDDGHDALDTDIYLPQDATMGPDGRLYFSDWNNHRIRVLDADGTVVTVAGTGLLGDGPDGPALEADFNHPTEIVFDPLGRMVIAAWHNSKLKRVDLATGLLEDTCGTGARAFAGDGGPAVAAALDLPASLVFAADGSTIVMDQANQVIRRIDQAGTISTIAGQCIVNECAAGEEPVMCPGSNKTACDLESEPDACGKPCLGGFAGDGGPALSMHMAQPFGQAADPAGRLALDPDGNLYFADTRNHRIRRIDSQGMVSTVAGNGTPGYSGEGGPATEAALNNPTDIDLAADGTLYIADTQSSCVRAVAPDGIITTVAGVCGQRGFAGEGGPATSALLDRPYGIELDRDGNLYVVDTYNNRIRMVPR